MLSDSSRIKQLSGTPYRIQELRIGARIENADSEAKRFSRLVTVSVQGSKASVSAGPGVASGSALGRR
jgi:hypothetical protein